jgi:hypothetical protein
MKILLAAVVINLLSCQPGPKQKTIEHSLNKSEINAPSSFLDSIRNNYELLTKQIREHTIIDSFYFTGRHSDATFTGDTILPLSNNFIGAIVDYDDKSNCIYKFLLIFSPGENKNTDYKRIYSECDRDESADYLRLDYELLNDSCFQTIESYIPKNSDSVSQVEKIKWNIDHHGLIDSSR